MFPFLFCLYNDEPILFSENRAQKLKNPNFVVSIMESAKSSGIDASLLNTCSNREEADTPLISHALHVFQIAGKITIMTFNTDLFDWFDYCHTQYLLLRPKDFHWLGTGSKRETVYLSQ